MLKSRPYNRNHLTAWNVRMSTDSIEPLYDNVVVAILKGQGVDVEYVPRNQYKVESLYEALERYQPENAPVVDTKDPDVKAGINFAFKVFSKPSYQPYLKAVQLEGHPSDVYRLLEIRGQSSAGLTAYGYTKAEAFSIAMRKLPDVLTRKKKPDPCLAGVRTQENKFGRLIWMYPYVMTILGGCLCRPLLNHFLDDEECPMAFGRRSAEMGIKMRKAASHCDFFVALDASKFDSTVGAVPIHAAFSALRTWFDPDQEVGYGACVRDVFDIVEDYFIHTPIVMPGEKGPLLYTGKRHGVPSGSYFTQIVDSFVNVMMAGALDRHFHLGIRRDELWVLGDDLLLYQRKAPDLERYAQMLQSKFGMLVNAVKSACGMVSEPFHFLGRTWRNGLPYRGFDEVVRKAVAPESFRKYHDPNAEARRVLWSYRNTAFISQAPPGFFGVLPYVPEGRRTFRSGYAEFLEREGLLSMRVSETLF